uniref:GINS complex subunit 3 n=1 Tax=Rousettus aegyptiacus TaxID=9407 RepID=A0A7J8CGE8_ROUAE|nr:GINS complex subunit 3 [Rousettus aegyptiacus]
MTMTVSSHLLRFLVPTWMGAQSWNSPCGWQKDFLTTSGGSSLWNFLGSTKRVGGLYSVRMPMWWTSIKWGPISMGLAPNSCILTVQRM